jgi:hypothetical protein
VSCYPWNLRLLRLSQEQELAKAYAAAVAAAYTKELLGEIEPALVEGTPPAAAAVMRESLEAVNMFNPVLHCTYG